MSFIVEDGLNTSYIDSLLIALFYTQTHLQNMLFQQPQDSKFVYLQELILNNFVNKIKKNYSIESSIINEIRNYSFVCDWKKNTYNLTGLFNVVDYFEFLTKGFDYNNLEIDIIEINRTKEFMKQLVIPYIEVVPKYDTNIKDLIDDWKNKIIRSNNKFISYNFKEIPLMIPIYINRKEINGSINVNKVDIYKKVKFKGKRVNLINDCEWNIHSIICHSSSGGGNYYSLIKNNNEWNIFSNNKIPSLSSFDMKNVNMCNKIKQECVLILYIYNDILK